jgi:hypothetical protein
LSNRFGLPLLGAAVLAAYALATVPWKSLGHRPRTPFDASAAGPAVASGYRLLRDAEGRIPAGATVAVATEPRDPVRDGYLQRFAVALLPGARVVPAGSAADFVAVVGPRPDPAPGELVLATAEGSLWRRRP